MKNRISDLRTKRRMTTTDLANVLNVSVRTIQKYENGSITPPPEKLKIMAEMFECSIDYILYLTDFSNSPSDNKESVISININPATKKILSDRLKDIIIQKEITKDTLSKSIKIDKELLNLYINGMQFPEIDILKKIAKRLNTTIDYLVGLDDNSGLNESVINIAGDYITKFEDEEDNNRLTRTAPAVLTQNGKTIKGYTYISNTDRKWLIEGEISSNGYFYGIYYAEKLIDKGIGNFFFMIDNNKMMKGLWSGYDSVNGKINSGKYSFKPVYNNFKLVSLKNSYIPQILDISDSELGKDYLSYEELKNVIKNSDEFICKVAIDKDSNKIMGFTMCIVSDSENVKKIISWPNEKLPRALEHSNKIGIIKTVAVYKRYQGLGIGNKLSQNSYDELIDKGVDSLCSIAWRNGEITNIGGILTNLGFKEHAVIENYWSEDSKEKGYDCPTCGKPPCNCTGIIYTKAIYS